VKRANHLSGNICGFRSAFFRQHFSTATFIGMERSALHRKLKLLGMAEEREDE
jgi:DNA-binding NtrC family response regulator